MANKIKININGMQYAIRTDEEPDYVASLAHELDKTVRALTDRGAMSMNEALMLTALNYLDLSKKAESGADHLRDQVTGYLEEAAKARLEAQEARREVERLERRLSGKQDKR